MSEWLLAAQSGSGTLINSRPFLFVPVAAFACRAAPKHPAVGTFEELLLLANQLVEPEVRQLRGQKSKGTYLKLGGAIG
jgi:hypothetical protein